MTSREPYRVGFVGLQTGRSWAAVAHLLGIRAQPERFRAAGVANRTYESSLAAAHANGIPNAYRSVDDLVNDAAVDIVAITVRVPHHRDVVIKALEAGRMVFCEWPLGKNLQEAEELAAFARQAKVRTFIGTQALASASIRYLKTLVTEGRIGKILSHSIIGYGRIWGPEISDEATERYLFDRANGATMLTIPVAHTLAACQDVFGDISDVNSILATRRTSVLSRQTNALVPMTAPDQVGVQGLLADGSVFSLHYRGGMPPDNDGFMWEINGSQGVLRLTGLTGSIQIENLRIERCAVGESGFVELSVPDALASLCPGEPIPGNFGRLYEGIWNDLVHDTCNAPDFDDALRLHQVIARIDKPRRTTMRQRATERTQGRRDE